MKDATWRSAVEPLLPAGEGWAVRGKVAWRRPAGVVVVGLLGESSGLDDGVYLRRLLLPLYVPTSVWDLSWSPRIGGGAHTWSAASLGDAVPAAVVDTPSDAAALRHLARRASADNASMLEAVAGARVLLGRRRRALRVVVAALGEPVAADARGRLERLREQLAGGDLEAARSDLVSRAEESAGRLGLR